MNFAKLRILLFSLSIILSSCSGFKEAGKVLRNEKKAASDEFLIEKKDPLTLPPDFNSIPEPGTIENKAESDKGSIEKILNARKNETNNKKQKSSSTENSILNQIKK
jgi:hypothetical protein